MKPMTTEYLMEHIQKGASGYAEYALKYPLKDSGLCEEKVED